MKLPSPRSTAIVTYSTKCAACTASDNSCGMRTGNGARYRLVSGHKISLFGYGISFGIWVRDRFIWVQISFGIVINGAPYSALCCHKIN